MTTERKIVIVLALAIVVCGSIAAWSAFNSHDARVRAEEHIKADEAIKAEKDKAIADRDAQLKQYQAAITAQQAKVQTSANAVQVIDHYLPSPAGALPGAIVAQKADLPASIAAKLPEAPSYVIETQDEAIAVAKGALQCDLNTKALNTCQADMKDTKANLVTEADEVKALQVEVKDGTKWHRFRSGLKHSLCGGAAVGSAMLAGKSNAQSGAVAGGAVFAGCELLVLK
jgi:cytoskeletal protein RodZ